MSASNEHWMRRMFARRNWPNSGTIVLAPDEKWDEYSERKGASWAVVHECSERAIYATLEDGETVEDLARDVRSVLPGCTVLIPAKEDAQ